MEKVLVSVIMGSQSDLPVMERAFDTLRGFGIPFETRILSAHRTPAEVEAYARGAAGRGVRVIIAAAGMSAALPGVIAAQSPLPVVGVPVKGMLDGLDALLSMAQMPPGVPVATVGVNAAANAALLAVRILALGDAQTARQLEAFREEQRRKVLKADEEVIKSKQADE
ncbi:MAG: 5-(carboxyamino)imidazole ribonucleotide mutase [Alloprevotella sp.]|nr:5-(carboxyamino)imidazole ribonucleotide mutase [Alloprevotella sp.]